MDVTSNERHIVSTALIELENWFRQQCNGQWEQVHGITIETLDNPGWAVKINLEGTKWGGAVFCALNVDNGPSDWISCSKKETQFEGYGDPSKLGKILEYFLTQVSTKPD